MSLATLGTKSTFDAKALLVGERIDVRSLAAIPRVGSNPIWLDIDDGAVAVFRYGVIVLFDVASGEEALLQRLAPQIIKPLNVGERESERLRIRIDSGAVESPHADSLVLQSATPEKLLLVADVLSQSAALARHEAQIALQFDRIEPFARVVDQSSRGAVAARELLNHLGGALLVEHDMVAQMEIEDTPDLLWDHPELESLWKRLGDEYELRQRYAAMNRKLALIARTAETALEVLHNSRALRVEWYIVGLIVFEILFSLYTHLQGGR